jgi:putative nucleotidyltransferase with HDIG domain
MTTDSPEKIKQLNTLIELSAIINSSLDIAEIRKRAIEPATELVNAEASSLLFIDEETGELYFDVAIGEKGEKVKTIRLKKGEGIAGWVAAHHQSLIINDVQSDSRFFKGADEKSGFVTKNMLCVPVKTKQKPVGVLQAINKKDTAFNNEDLDILTALSNQVAVAIENARLYDELRETFYATVHALAETIEKRDPYTGGHTKRVMNYSLAIGRMMGLSKKDMVNLKLAAILHDIGKIGIRDNVLLKTEKLNHDEFENIMMHTVYGAEILNYVRQLKDIIPGVKYHHEKHDGSGYPDGLKGNDVPLIARIIAVADTFDAMTTDRIYRKGLSFDAAFEELKNHSGLQFGPDVVNAFFKAYEELEIAV